MTRCFKRWGDPCPRGTKCEILGACQSPPVISPGEAMRLARPLPPATEHYPKASPYQGSARIRPGYLSGCSCGWSGHRFPLDVYGLSGARTAALVAARCHAERAEADGGGGRG